MISTLFNDFIYTPLYNGLVGIISILPFADVGFAVILLTVVVKLVMFPVSQKAARTQRLMKAIEGPMKKIREKYKNNREEQGRKLLELYREKGINPLSGFLTLFIQLPVILGLYWVFLRAGLPEIDSELLYSFVPTPENVHMMFLGLVDMASKNYFLAFLAGLSQFFQAKYALPAPAPRKENATFQEDFARSLQLQMKFVLPVVIAVVAYIASAAVALYWITSNIFAIGQEIYVKRKLEAEEEEKDTEEK
jgi:YidC/Oxa1 family membrane protein insertase